MAVSITFFVDSPEGGRIEEAEFDGAENLKDLMDPDNPAGIEILSDTQEVRIWDDLDGLILGICLGGGRALETGERYENESFSGYDTAVISVDGDNAVFECEGDTLSAPKGECLVALRGLAGRYGVLLEKAFPGEERRRSRIVAFANG